MKSLSVAVSADFFTAFAQIPKKQQAKVLEFVNKFRTNPMSSGINYEKINGAKDKNLRSVRIDNTYRGIIMKPESGNVYLLLWVDHHDNAYDWAKNRWCDINPETGSIQVYQVNEETPQHNSTPENTPTALFSSLRDREIIKLGIPEAQIDLVRGITSISDLTEFKDSFPADSYEALHFLAQGDKLEDVLMLIDSYKPESLIDTSDFTAALYNPISLQKFSVDPTEQELKAMLSAPLEKWRVFLHPSQRTLVEKDWNGPVRLLGGAGTGKTVVALHRAKWLAENRCQENEKILLTTFTKNLAADIENNLKTICSPEALKKIQVTNLDKWCSDFLKQNDYRFEIAYGNQTEKLWEQALQATPPTQFKDSFFKEEWERIIQPEGITNLSEYFRVSRVGRGVRLGRKERKLVWPVFEEYRILLNEHRLREPADAMRDARELLQQMQPKPFCGVIVDEAQDMSKQAFLLLRSLTPEDKNDLFITGDAHQRIYGQKITLSQCGINIRGRARKLKINYRTTEEIRAWATNVMKGVVVDDLDGSLDDNSAYTSLLHGESPETLVLNNPDEELNVITSYINDLEKNNFALNDVCIVARTNQLVKKYETLLTEYGLTTYAIKRSQPDDRSVYGVRIATMHRVKGLEFAAMIVAGASDQNLPLSTYSSEDQTVTANRLEKERALLYVAATRAKRRLLITGYGAQSPIIPNDI